MACVAIVWLTVALHIPTQSCVMPGKYVGWTYFNEAQRPFLVQLAHDRVAAKLHRGLAGDPRDLAPAVWVVAHELGHVRTRSGHEADANRWAARNWWLVVRTLGGSWKKAVQMWSYLLPPK